MHDCDPHNQIHNLVLQGAPGDMKTRSYKSCYSFRISIHLTYAYLRYLSGMTI